MRPPRQQRSWTARPIRVCFMIDQLRAAGTESQLIALIRNLDRQSVQPFLCLLDGEDLQSQALEPPDCPVLRLGVRSLHHVSTLPRALQLAQFLRDRRIDVLQVYFPDSTYLGVPVARLAGVPLVVRTRNNLGYWMSPLDRFLGRIYNRWVDRVVANCEPCRQAVIDDEGATPSSVVVLENGVDLCRFAINTPRTSPGRLRHVGMVANLRPVKDVELLVRAAAEVVVRHPDVTFTIAGEGELRPTLERLIKELGLIDRFFLPGSIQDIPAFLASLDIAVLCSRSEGMSNAVLEYMAAGKPTVATAVGANVQLIENGVNGLLVPPGDKAKLAGALDRMLSDPWGAAQMAAAARRCVQEHYSREAMVRRFENFYRELLR